MHVCSLQFKELDLDVWGVQVLEQLICCFLRKVLKLLFKLMCLISFHHGKLPPYIACVVKVCLMCRITFWRCWIDSNTTLQHYFISHIQGVCLHWESRFMVFVLQYNLLMIAVKSVTLVFRWYLACHHEQPLCFFRGASSDCFQLGLVIRCWPRSSGGGQNV